MLAMNGHTVAHHFNHQVLTKPDNERHQQQQEQGHKAAVQRRHLQLVFPERHERVGNSNAIDPQQRTNREEIEERDNHATRLTKVLFYRFSDVAGRV